MPYTVNSFLLWATNLGPGAGAELAIRQALDKSNWNSNQQSWKKETLAISHWALQSQSLWGVHVAAGGSLWAIQPGGIPRSWSLGLPTRAPFLVSPCLGRAKQGQWRAKQQAVAIETLWLELGSKDTDRDFKCIQKENKQETNEQTHNKLLPSSIQHMLQCVCTKWHYNDTRSPALRSTHVPRALIPLSSLLKRGLVTKPGVHKWGIQFGTCTSLDSTRLLCVTWLAWWPLQPFFSFSFPFLYQWNLDGRWAWIF